MKEIIIDGVEYILSPKEDKRVGGWRLPTIEELLTLVDYSLCNPACKLASSSSDNYWSSTTYANNTNYAWYVFFGNGFSYYNNKSYTYNVRYVREGKNGLEWSKTFNPMTWEDAIKFAETLETEVYYKSEQLNNSESTKHTTY